MTLPPMSPEEHRQLVSEVMRSGTTICPRCGDRVFHAVPGRTTPEEIRAVAKLAGWTEIERDEWVHPGCYCLGGCFSVLVEYAPSLFLVSAGTRRLEVILRVKELLRLSLNEARGLVDRGEVRLLEDAGSPLYCDPWCRKVKAEFEELGATLRIGF